jgi:hypothetical protein
LTAQEAKGLFVFAAFLHTAALSLPLHAESAGNSAGAALTGFCSNCFPAVTAGTLLEIAQHFPEWDGMISILLKI